MTEPNKQREWTVYGLKDPRDGSIRYVGASFKLSDRFATHLRDCDIGRDPRRQWLVELGGAGMKPELVILEKGNSPESVEVETRWIAKFRSEGKQLTNLSAGGPGQTGIPATAARREVMRRHMTGRAKSPETRARLKAAFKNRPAEYFERISAILRERAKRPVSEKTRAKMSASAKARIRTAEENAKRSAAMKGRPWSDKRRASEESRRKEQQR